MPLVLAAHYTGEAEPGSLPTICGGRRGATRAWRWERSTLGRHQSLRARDVLISRGPTLEVRVASTGTWVGCAGCCACFDSPDLRLLDGGGWWCGGRMAAAVELLSGQRPRPSPHWRYSWPFCAQPGGTALGVQGFLAPTDGPASEVGTRTAFSPSGVLETGR